MCITLWILANQRGSAHSPNRCIGDGGQVFIELNYFPLGANWTLPQLSLVNGEAALDLRYNLVFYCQFVFDLRVIREGTDVAFNSRRARITDQLYLQLRIIKPLKRSQCLEKILYFCLFIFLT